ncbi:MAG: M48 family metallopeptidase [Lentisphaeria bacterium]|nr:M48 family metallopeptidase [Lentisphaeria bacterium]
MPEKSSIRVTLPQCRESLSVFLRYSPKAARCTLRVKEENVELVLPLFMPQSEALSFLESCLPWLEKTLKKRWLLPGMSGRKKVIREYPDKLTFSALGKVCPVFYTFLDVPWVGVKMDEENSCMRVSGNVLCPEAVTEALENFILRKAEEYLKEKLRQLSYETAFPYKKCAVRLQSTRWGSCSSSGTISLNAMLLFVPEECVHYVLIHELCHIKHMDHSSFFWQEVAKYVPRWKYYRSLLKRTPVPVLGKRS